MVLGATLAHLLLLYGRKRTEVQLRDALVRDQAILADLPTESLAALQLRKRINATAVLYSTRLVLRKQRRAARVWAVVHGGAMMAIFSASVAHPRDLLDFMIGCTCTGFFARFLIRDLQTVFHRNILSPVLRPMAEAETDPEPKPGEGPPASDASEDPDDGTD